jgi:hypothetical protein
VREAPGFFGDMEMAIKSAIYDLMDVRGSAILNAERLAPLLLQAFLEGASNAAARRRIPCGEAAQASLRTFVDSLTQAKRE